MNNPKRCKEEFTTFVTREASSGVHAKYRSPATKNQAALGMRCQWANPGSIYPRKDNGHGGESQNFSSRKCRWQVSTIAQLAWQHQKVESLEYLDSCLVIQQFSAINWFSA